MNRGTPSQTLYLSFSEFVWTALMALILVFAFCQNKAREESVRLQEALSTDKARMDKFKKDQQALEEQVKKDEETIGAITAERDRKEKDNNALRKQLADAEDAFTREKSRLEKEKEALVSKLADANKLVEQLSGSGTSVAAALRQESARANELEKENKTLTARNTALDAENEGLKKEKSQLQSSIQRIVAEKEGLQKALDALQKEYDALVKLERNHLDLVAKLEEANKTIAGLKVDKSASETRIRELLSEKGKLQSERDALSKDAADARKTIEDFAAKIADANAIVADLTAKNADSSRQNETQKAQEGQRITEAKKPLENEIARLRAEREMLKTGIDKLKKDYLVISRDMIDIRGELDKVICVVDCSSSMAFENKWKVTRGIIGTWISNLDIRQLMLVTYNEAATCFPDSYLDVSKSLGDSNRNLNRVLQYLEGITPQSYSDTYGALAEAYKHDPSTIILFTDGSPNRTNRINLDEEEMERIIKELVERHTEVHINIIAFGDYFNSKTGNYFRRITDLTGGTFIGR